MPHLPTIPSLENPRLADEIPGFTGQAQRLAGESRSFTPEAPSLNREIPSLADHNPSLIREIQSLTDETPSLTREIQNLKIHPPSQEDECLSFIRESLSVIDEKMIRGGAKAELSEMRGPLAGWHKGLKPGETLY